MNLEEITKTLETIGHYGHVISTEENLILSNSLLILQNENHFRKIYFWGKIFGSDKDYYIVYGYQRDALVGRVFYYSTNCLNWGLLPSPTENGKLLTPLCTTKFHGDPAIIVDILIEKSETGVPETRTRPTIMKLKEEDRLSTTVYLINEEAFLVPRGSLYRRPDGITVENLNFEGLKQLEARELSYYLHYRIPRQKWNTNLLTRQDYNYSCDFLDPLDIDVPEGCWVIQLVAGETLSIVKSLYWPGVVFFHSLETNKYGSFYFGHGKKCLDTPFMLNFF